MNFTQIESLYERWKKSGIWKRPISHFQQHAELLPAYYQIKKWFEIEGARRRNIEVEDIKNN